MILPYIVRTDHHDNDILYFIQDSQDNVISIYKEVSKWEKIPLFTRIRSTDSRRLPLELEGKERHKEERYSALRSAALKVQKLVQSNLNIFNIDLRSKVAAKRWKNYLLYLDAIVRGSVIQTVFARN